MRGVENKGLHLSTMFGVLVQSLDHDFFARLVACNCILVPHFGVVVIKITYLKVRVEGFEYVGVGNSTNKKDSQTNAAMDFLQYLVRVGKVQASEVPSLEVGFKRCSYSVYVPIVSLSLIRRFIN